MSRSGKKFITQQKDCCFTRNYSKLIEMQASHLLIKSNKSRNPVSRRTNQPVTMSEQEARDLLSSLELTPENFASQAKKYSDCGSYARGGDLGKFNRGDMQKPFEDAVLALKPGEMSGIVCTDSGLHRILRTG